MGSNASKSYSNSSKSESESTSNSGKNDKLDSMACLKENENAIINRVWIVKKSITLKNRINPLMYLPFIGPLFGISNMQFKHWAIILELSNNSFVNIQFGRNGFSLEEFNRIENNEENLYNAINETWGQKKFPVSFCYLGNANYKYDDLKNFLYEIKKKETERFNNNGCVYYNFTFRNCQHFVCDIEKILFGKIKVWHSFDYYLDQFFIEFFPDIATKRLTELRKKLMAIQKKLLSQDHK